MRVVVTGATGNVGTSVVAALANDASVDEIIGIARRVPALGMPKTRWRGADVTSADLTRVFRGADAVVHLAWALQPARRPQHLESVNIDGTSRVLDAVRAAEVPALVYASSVGAYSPGPRGDAALARAATGPGRRASPKGAVDESWPTNGIPTSLYSRQKAQVERMLDAFEQAVPRVRVVRLRKALVFKREAASEIARLFLGRRVPLRLLGWLRPPLLPVTKHLAVQAVHSLDAGEAYRLAVRFDAQGAFNIAADPVLDVPALARIAGAWPVRVPERALRLLVQASWRARLQPTDAGWLDLARCAPIMDTSRAESELRFRPRFTAEEALSELLQGMRERCGIATDPLAPQGGVTLEPRVPAPTDLGRPLLQS
jgi:UDP-glucose 4-epimerase